MSLEYPLTEAQRAVREEARLFAAVHLAPIAQRVDQSDRADVELNALMQRSGLLRHFVPEALGGAGISVTNLCLIREELGRVCVRADEFFAAQGITVQPIVLWGSPEQQRTYLSGLLDGSRLFAFCLTEPGAGSDVAAIATTATEGVNQFLLNGTKRFAYQPEVCNTFLVFAKTDPQLEARGISAFILDSPDEGFLCRPFPLLFPSPEAEVVLSDCPVPAANMLGPRGRGMRVALSNLDRLRPSVGAAAVGMAASALEAAVAHLKERTAFGGPLSIKQGLRFMLARAATELDAARLLVYAAAANADGEAKDVAACSAESKLFATEVAQRVIDTALQLHGGAGLARGSLTERLYKAVRAMRIYEGSSEIMQLVIARGLFKDGVL